MPKQSVKKAVSCPVEDTLAVISGRWKVMIIYNLLRGEMRFNELQRALPGVTHRTLAQQLREMEAAGLVIRRDHQEIPPRVDYRLSALGRSLESVLNAMHEWAETHAHKVKA